MWNHACGSAGCCSKRWLLGVAGSFLWESLRTLTWARAGAAKHVQQMPMPWRACGSPSAAFPMSDESCLWLLTAPFSLGTGHPCPALFDLLNRGLYPLQFIAWQKTEFLQFPALIAFGIQSGLSTWLREWVSWQLTMIHHAITHRLYRLGILPRTSA